MLGKKSSYIAPRWAQRHVKTLPLANPHILHSIRDKLQY